MFLSILNRTNPCVTAWGSVSNLNAPKGSTKIKRLKHTDVLFWHELKSHRLQTGILVQHGKSDRITHIVVKKEL